MSRKSLICCVAAALACGAGVGATPTQASVLDRGPADTLVVCGVTTVTTSPRQTALGCGFNNSGATYDLVSGQFSVGAIGNGADAALTAHDIFKLSGPSSTKPIPFSVQLAIHVGAMYLGCAVARISSGNQAQEFTTPLSWPGADSYQILTLTMSQAVEARFHLALFLHAVSPGAHAGLDNQATASGRLTFVLPPDYVVTSDQGYSSVPTPTRVTTWGRLKTIYR